MQPGSSPACLGTARAAACKPVSHIHLSLLDAAGVSASAPPALQLLRCVSRTSLMTKLAPHLAEQLTDIVTDAVLTIRQPDQPLDLYMVRQQPGQRSGQRQDGCSGLAHHVCWMACRSLLACAALGQQKSRSSR